MIYSFEELKKEFLEELDENTTDDAMYEIADSYTPMMNYDLAMYIAENLWLGCQEAEREGDIFDQIQDVIYRELIQAGREYLDGCD